MCAFEPTQENNTHTHTHIRALTYQLTTISHDPSRCKCTRIYTHTDTPGDVDCGENATTTTNNNNKMMMQMRYI